VYPPCAKGAVATAIESQPQHRLGKGLRHSGFYLDAQVVKTIGDWLERPPNAVAQSDSALSTTPSVSEIRRPDPDTVFFRCILVLVTIILLGTSWSVWEMFHHFRDIPSELTSGSVVRREVLVQAQTYVLGPKEERMLPIVLRRPPAGQTSYITCHYKSNSVEGHVFLGLSKGATEWKSVSGVCPWTVKRAYSGGLGPRELSFGRELDFGNDSTMQACVDIKNYGKKTQAAFDVEIWLEFVAK
jgi:hypothetical protein